MLVGVPATTIASRVATGDGSAAGVFVDHVAAIAHTTPHAPEEAR